MNELLDSLVEVMKDRGQWRDPGDVVKAVEASEKVKKAGINRIQ